MNEAWAAQIAAFARSHVRPQKPHKRALLFKFCVRSAGPAFQKHSKILRLQLSASFRKVSFAKSPQVSAGFMNERASELEADGIALLYSLTRALPPQNPCDF